jgi:predicted DsbA family dithiol-disulfide isomerase
MSLTIDIHSDVICPWCWIGKRRLEQALPAVPEAAGASVRWHPFQLNPGMPAAGMPRAEYRRRKFGSAEYAQALDARVTGVAAAEGLAFDLAGQARTPNTVLAHRLIWLAGRRGRQDAVVEALFAAYFSAGLDLGDAAVLARIAADHGFAAGEVARFLVGGEGEREVAAEEAEVRTAGIDGVPLFRIGTERIAGAQPVAVFVAALRQAAVVAAEGPGDCGDGLCRSDGA